MLFWRGTGRMSPGLIAAVLLSNVLLVALLTINAVIPPTSGGVAAALLDSVVANSGNLVSCCIARRWKRHRAGYAAFINDWSRELAQNVMNLNEMPQGARRVSRSAVPSQPKARARMRVETWKCVTSRSQLSQQVPSQPTHARTCERRCRGHEKESNWLAHFYAVRRG